MFIISENSLCYRSSLTARRKLDEIFAQGDNVTTAYLKKKFYCDINLSVGWLFNQPTGYNNCYRVT